MHSQFYQNKFRSNKTAKILKIQHTEVETTRSTKPMTTKTSDQQPTKRYYANILAAGLRKKQMFINITNNKEIPKRNDQEENNELNINYLPNQEVWIKQKFKQLKATGLRKRDSSLNQTKNHKLHRDAEPHFIDKTCHGLPSFQWANNRAIQATASWR